MKSEIGDLGRRGVVKAIPRRVNERDDEPKCQWPRRAKGARCERGMNAVCSMRREFERDMMA